MVGRGVGVFLPHRVNKSIKLVLYVKVLQCVWHTVNIVFVTILNASTTKLLNYLNLKLLAVTRNFTFPFHPTIHMYSMNLNLLCQNKALLRKLQ